jgi:hypothetical protein
VENETRLVPPFLAVFVFDPTTPTGFVLGAAPPTGLGAAHPTGLGAAHPTGLGAAGNVPDPPPVLLFPLESPPVSRNTK